MRPSTQRCSSTSCATPDKRPVHRAFRRGRRASAARAPAWSARSCGPSAGRSGSPRRRCRSWAATGRRSRAPRCRHAIAPCDVATRKPPSSVRRDRTSRRGDRRSNLDAGALDGPQQGVQDVARAVAVGKQLAVGLFVQRNVQLAERSATASSAVNARRTRLISVRRPPQKSPRTRRGW